MKNWHRWGVLLVIGLCGCSGGSTEEGTEAAARKFFEAEFQKWMAGEEAQVTTMKSQIENLKEPIGYDIRSIVSEKPDILAIAEHFSENGETSEADGKTSEEDGEWKAWKFNVAIEWQSQAGTPIEKVTTYTLTWNPRDKKWFVTERN